jgi:hypothetical protein
MPSPSRVLESGEGSERFTFFADDLRRRDLDAEAARSFVAVVVAVEAEDGGRADLLLPVPRLEALFDWRTGKGQLNSVETKEGRTSHTSELELDEGVGVVERPGRIDDELLRGRGIHRSCEGLGGRWRGCSRW